MQIDKETWKEVVQIYIKKDYTWDDAWDPEKNIEVGCRYIKWLYSYIKRYIAPTQPLLHKRMIAAYNWGIGNLQRNRFSLEGIPRETEEHIARVIKTWKEYKKAQMVEIPRERLKVIRTLANGIKKEANSHLGKKEAK